MLLNDKACVKRRNAKSNLVMQAVLLRIAACATNMFERAFRRLIFYDELGTSLSAQRDQVRSTACNLHVQSVPQNILISLLV